MLTEWSPSPHRPPLALASPSCSSFSEGPWKCPQKPYLDLYIINWQHSQEMPYFRTKILHALRGRGLALALVQAGHRKDPNPDKFLVSLDRQHWFHSLIVIYNLSRLYEFICFLTVITHSCDATPTSPSSNPYAVSSTLILVTHILILNPFILTLSPTILLQCWFFSLHLATSIFWRHSEVPLEFGKSSQGE